VKILFLVSSMNAGGAERVAATLANAWARRGDSVTLTPTYTDRGSCFYSVSSDVELVWLADRIGPRRFPWLTGFSKWRALRRLMREKQPDLIVSFLTNVNVMALLSARGLRARVIVCERTDPAVGATFGPILAWLRWWTYPWADLVTVQTQASVAPFKKMVPGMRALAVIPNPLPPALLDFPPALRQADPNGRRRLMAMGRLVPAKQFSRLIDAFLELAADHPDWDLVIWGEGPLRDVLSRQIQEAGLASRITLAGRTDAPWRELSQANAFVLTSAIEGFPNVLLEAMALGLPCIAFDCPSGPREITRGGQDALLIPAGDQKALVRNLNGLLGDADLRDRLAHRALSVRDRYALSAVLSVWDAVMRQLGVSARLSATPAEKRDA
jgi:GalNAc-alpha-(1->4)-GalNAc-alpha-(1->3)-diNAcBac-PP-undecaprenol alpha-1,4-N-acetyl-D-galactosaminyltransferase